MKFSIKKITILLCLIFPIVLSAQTTVLTKQEAVDLTLKNNYNIRLTETNINIAKQNKKKENNGYLPTVSTNANASYSINGARVKLQDNSINKVRGADNQNYNIGINANYTIFDGHRRKNTYEQFQERYDLTLLQARQVMENTLIGLFTKYYEIARLTENVKAQKQSIAISKTRLTRAEYKQEYGQGSKLAILNAAVDINNDTTAYLNLVQQLENAKRDLNMILDQDLNTNFEVDTTIIYGQLSLEELLETAQKENISILQVQKNIDILAFNEKISDAVRLPTVNATAGYSISHSRSTPTSPFSALNNTQNGLNVGINASWNIFDGGLRKINIEKAKINLANQKLVKEQTEKKVALDVQNAWSIYENALFVLNIQQKNIETTIINFEQTNERFKMGRMTSIDFRQAQLNLTNARLQLSQAKYNAKLAELNLLQLSGILLDAKF